MSESERQLPESGTVTSNLGDPIKLSDLQLNGISAEAARGGDIVKVWTRLSLTSDDRIFHQIVENLSQHIEFRATESGKNVNLRRAALVLLVIHPDNTGELWVDTIASAIQVMPKRDLAAGSLVFEHDIADVMGMSFPLVEIGKKDRVICLFQEGWRYALFCDFNPKGDLSTSAMERDLGKLYRELKYRYLYDAITNQSIFDRLIVSGWFPFVEILGLEFRMLLDSCEAGFELSEVETEILAKFDTQRLERMFSRWMTKSHFAGKERFFRSALKSYGDADAIPVIKIALTEIEGILGDAYRQIHGKGAKIKKLLEFAIESAEKKTGQPNTLLFSSSFARYLESHTFANYDPAARTGNSSSRHAVGHGAADAESYTMTRALQALLTLDQLAFYT